MGKPPTKPCTTSSRRSPLRRRVRIRRFRATWRPFASSVCKKIHHAVTPGAAGARYADDLHRFLDGKPCWLGRSELWERVEVGCAAGRRWCAAADSGISASCSYLRAGRAFGSAINEADRRAASSTRNKGPRIDHDGRWPCVDDRRQDERWGKGVLVLTEALTQVADANSPALTEKDSSRPKRDIEIAADLERVADVNSPLETDGYYYYRSRQAEFQEAFNRTGIKNRRRRATSCRMDSGVCNPPAVRLQPSMTGTGSVS